MSKKDPTIQEMIEDFKQYVAVTVRNEVLESEKRVKKELREELTAEIRGESDSIRAEMRAGFEGVGDAIARNQDDLDDHERRITALEAA